MFTSVDLINSSNNEEPRYGEFDVIARRTVVHSEFGFDFSIESISHLFLSTTFNFKVKKGDTTIIRGSSILCIDCAIKNVVSQVERLQLPINPKEDKYDEIANTLNLDEFAILGMVLDYAGTENSIYSKGLISAVEKYKN